MEISRGGDITARWGGEEFIILLPETGADQAALLAERLRERIGDLRLGTLRRPIHLSASFGIAERLSFDTLTVWTAAVGVAVLAQRSHHEIGASDEPVR